MKNTSYIAFLVFGAMLVLYYLCLPSDLMDQSYSTVLSDRNEELLSARIANDGQWRFPERDSLPYKFKASLICFEDREFYLHHGVHFPSIARAIVQNLRNGERVSGGSTISMQTIRLLRKNPPRTYWEKLKEMVMATRLEWRYDKDEILCIWSSHAPFGGNVVGLDAAAWRYFGRSAEELSWAESATLAVLPNAPSLIFPGRNQELLIEKRNRLLMNMVHCGIIDSLTAELAIAEPVPGPPHPLPQKAFHMMQTLESTSGKGKHYKSTLDLNIQNRSEEILEAHHLKLQKNGVNNLAAIVIRTSDQSIAAYVGNIWKDNQEHGGHVDVIQSPRSTGSILKPLLYANMLDKGELLPDMLVSDTPVRMGSFAPKNYNEGYDGAVPASMALSRSLNIPAVHLLENHGVENFHQKLKELGFDHINHGPNHYGLSLILGGAEATPYEVARAYSKLSYDLLHFRTNNSKYQTLPPELNWLKNEDKNAELSEHSIIGAGAVYNTFDALLKVNRPGSEEGWEMFSSSVPVAWKTGTSYGFRDAWSVGCTPEYVICVWAGNADGEGRPGLTGVTSAAPVLFDLLHMLNPQSWFEVPYDDMREIAVCKLSGHPAAEMCPLSDTILVSGKQELVQPCPYHKRIFVNSRGKRVNRNCYRGQDILEKSWFELNPVQAWYYRQKNATYKSMPEWHEDCAAMIDNKTLDMIYPLPGQEIFLPVDYDKKKSPLVLEAAHQRVNSTLFWHLDNEYLGSTREIHKMNVTPSPGSHQLIIWDEEGNESKVEFSIIDK